MKVVLSTLNSKFIHSALSIRYLKEYVKDIIPVEIKEYTINQNQDFIASELYKLEADLIGFSTYIWNVEEIIKIASILKIVNPRIKIILGGPEVSYDSIEILKKNPYIDYLIYGEGEETFREFIETFIKGEEDFSCVRGLVYRDGEEITKNPPRPLIDELNKISTPYDIIGDEFQNKIVYFESSRGCPFHCKFCLSSTIRGVRYFPLERVKEELDRLIDAKVKQVKFVDRTFNANTKYSMEIMNHIMKRNPKGINFHFEVTAHLVGKEMLEFLFGVREGLFQFEIGVQSTNPDTIEAIGRTTDFEKLREVSKRIKSYGNIHQHLDLIAGLPYEDYDSFKNSFNQVYEIEPEKIQLGFLKLLKGSELREKNMEYGFKYLNSSPYEVLETKYIKYQDILKLKGIEELVEKYYNEGYFKYSLKHIIKDNYGSPFEFFEEFSSYWNLKDHNQVSNSRAKLYEILAEFYKHKLFNKFNVFKEIIRFDFIMNNKSTKMPSLIINKEDIVEKVNIHELLKDKWILDNCIDEYKEIPTKQLLKDVRVERFNIDVLDMMEGCYLDKDIIEMEVYVLFLYKDTSMKRCITYNIKKFVKGKI